ncbi:PBP1 and LysM peptidoglycan-binding domain-containing protein [Aurantibacillus circumpalustris]|uniref:PBP1 and LysM peptidoglycan-binding domain-containing protein n=1 Tax=Aurantibacillus circumpalustris TaxID=3036359 RepID=UPI00295A5F0A|nr:LysM peptidoglycan-binding domain-containing protein [Aurantibacillus circumpalustris]
MIKNNLNKYFLACIFCIISVVFFGQTKSSNIQTIDGKKYYIHKIQKSQSLYSISKTYTVSLDEIYKLNPELKTQGAKVDQEIKIPFGVSAPVVITPTVSPGIPTIVIDTNKYVVHKIAKSETVYSITRHYKITEKELAAFNPGITPALKEGQLIIVGERIRKKSGPKENKQTIVTPEAVVNNFSVVDSSLFKPALKAKKTKYKVALILPFRTEATLALDMNELVKSGGSFPMVPGLAVDFYLGFKCAMDSLISNDFEVDLTLYESDDKDSIKLDLIVNDPGFKDLDFIFGPLYASGFKDISQKAKELNIPIVSPITQQNKILYNNIYISKTNPSQFTLMESLADYCIDSLVNGNAKIILMLLSDKDKRELSFVTAFKKYYNEKQKALGKGIQDTITLANGMEGLKAAFKPNAKNIVVTLSSNQVFLTDFTTQFSMFGDKKDVTLCGWQNLTESDNIDQEYLNQLHFTFPNQFNLTNTEAYNTATARYKEQQQTAPGEYFYIGFDIAYYYLTNLKKIGPDFIYRLETLPFETNYMRFKYARPDYTTGFDNRGVYIFKYSNYHIQKTGWK